MLILLLLLLPLPQIPGCRDGVVSWRWDCGTGTSTQQPHHYHLHHSFSHLNYELSSEWAIYLIARLHHGSHWCSCHAVVFPTESPAKQWERDAAHALPVTCVYLVACICVSNEAWASVIMCIACWGYTLVVTDRTDTSYYVDTRTGSECAA